MTSDSIEPPLTDELFVDVVPEASFVADEYDILGFLVGEWGLSYPEAEDYIEDDETYTLGQLATLRREWLDREFGPSDF